MTKSATRHDQDKSDYTHIAPVIWAAQFNNMATGSSLEKIKCMSDLMDNWYYRGATGLSVFPYLIKQATPVLEFGAVKYASLNYLKGMAASRVMKSFRRHCMEIFINGIDALDEESGLPHTGHMACNYIFAATYMEMKPEGFIDDRVNIAE